MWSDLFIGIQTYHGEDDGATLTDDVDIAICTIEKANSLFNQLLDSKEEDRIHMIVVDELHLISDDKRGFLLEVLLSKVLFTLQDKVQIVAMSATLPNMIDLSSWIHGSLYTTLYRPVNLEVRIACDAKLFKVETLSPSSVTSASASPQLIFDRPIQRLLQGQGQSHGAAGGGRGGTPGPVQGMEKAKVMIGDEDGFLSLCVETLVLKKSLLIFCSSKKRCEACVTRIADLIQEGGVPSHLSSSLSSSAAEEQQGYSNHGNRILVHERRLSLMNQLRQTSVGLCPLLRKSLLHGVAYHHAGLTVEERKVTPPLPPPPPPCDAGFVVRSLKMAFALERSQSCAPLLLSLLGYAPSSSLYPDSSDSQVNLPAHRVIIRSPTMGNSELSIASFRQMCGRAGRMGLDSEVSFSPPVTCDL
jgi:DNA polymerase theta